MVKLIWCGSWATAFGRARVREVLCIFCRLLPSRFDFFCLADLLDNLYCPAAAVYARNLDVQGTEYILSSSDREGQRAMGAIVASLLRKLRKPSESGLRAWSESGESLAWRSADDSEDFPAGLQTPARRARTVAATDSDTAVP